MKKYIFTGVLKDEMNGFLKMRESQGFKDGHRFILESLDKYLASQEIFKKALEPTVVDSWLAYACTGQSTSSKNGFISYYNSFSKYLKVIDIDVFVPEHVRVHEEYVPYIFSEQEMARIFEAVDAIQLKSYVKPQAQFSILLRILYGCGLRLGEALALTKRDADLDSGVLFIYDAKDHRDRLAPIDQTLITALSLYSDYFLRGKPDDAWFFESDMEGKIRNCIGKPRTPKWAQEHFRRVLNNAGVDLPELPRKQRNICLHCLRHTFIVHSFRKQDLAGIDNYDPAASISVYVGHYGLTGTQRYLRMTAENSIDIINATNEYSKNMFPNPSDKVADIIEKPRSSAVSEAVQSEPEYTPNACSKGLFPEVPR
ncbi:MAG: tyrosine-type recombinase/integrase [Oscillospiraceae bacterium]|nr:tyrosine-type recombinase/integrase [Oscillospiraceae bacterium]